MMRSRIPLVVFSALCGVDGASREARRERGPTNGAPFLAAMRLRVQPTEELDAEDPTMVVQRLNMAPLPSRDDASSACDLGGNAVKDECLAKSGCMWVNLGNVNQYCMPCEIDAAEIPCWNEGAIVSGLAVKECAMQCSHQKVVRQPEYTCVDASEFITESQCFDKGAKSGSKCMHISYDDGGTLKSSCAPCQVSGTGLWDCPAVGSPGPGWQTTVQSCNSMCTAPPPPPLPPPGQNSPGIVKTTVDRKTMVAAPFPIPPPPPPTAAEIVAAATAAAQAVGTPTAPPPDVYFPVVMYRKPKDYLANAPGLR